MNPIEQRIGARLRALRESKGVSRLWLARAIGTTSQEVEDYEAGKRSPAVSEVVKAAGALGGSAADLIGDAHDGWTDALNGLAQTGAEGSAELVSAFTAIADTRTRRAFLEFAWSLVGAEEGAPQT